MKKILLVIIVIFNLSCREEFALKKEEFLLNPETKSWKADKVTEMNFIGNNGEKITFKLEYEKEEFTPQKTTIAGVPTTISNYEQITQSFLALGNRFSIILTGYNEPFGNHINIGFNNILLVYNTTRFELFSLYIDNANFSNANTPGSRPPFITSTAKILSDYQINNKILPKVFLFELKDGTIKDTDIQMFAMAPKVGLIYFKTKNGTEFFRENL